MNAQGVVNKSGQALGRKGHGTRRRVIEATEKLLAQSRGIAPSVAAVAREAGISPPTFYLYFADVGEAILAAIEQVGAPFEPVVAVLAESWPQDTLYDCALRFVQVYLDYWRENATLLRARNRLADEGDERFVLLRLHAVARLSEAIEAKLPVATIDGKKVAEAPELSGVLLTALERMSTVMALDLYPTGLNDADRMTHAIAYTLFRTLSPPSS